MRNHMVSIRGVSLIGTLLIALNSYGGPPTQVIGVGSPDFTNLTGIPNSFPNGISLGGYATFSGYSNPLDEVIPPGMIYMSLYIYGRGYEASAFCTIGGQLCNIPVVPGQSLSSVITSIPRQFNPRPPYWITANSTAGVCGGWVLSDGKDASLAQYSIGTFRCGVRPPDTQCEITPNDLSINITVNKGDKATGTVRGSVHCNRTANVRIRTPDIPDSRLYLGPRGYAPVATLTINGRPSGLGADMTVGIGSDLTITANIDDTNNAGEYSGSTAVIIEYR
ncbi:hypothetical protein SESI111939_18775 [Serratia silvae]